MKSANWIEQADQAILRAAARARAAAASTRTAMHILKDGRILELMPTNEDPPPKPVKHEDQPGLSIVREDTPSSGDEKP